MEFISVFDEASRDHEAEDLAAREAAARVDAQEVWPFLALASSPEEFGHRLALAEGRLSGIASRHGLTYEDVTAPLREGFAVLHPREAGGESCRNCGHANPPHRKGGLCSVCGCESFQPGTHGSRQAAKDEDEGIRFSFDERIASLRTALVEGQDPLGWLADESAPATPTHHDTTEHLLGNTPVAIDQAMSGGGGSGTPENPGGHSQTQKTTARGDAPFG